MVDWTNITLQKTEEFWQGFLVFVPKLILALVIFIIGWIIAAAIGRLIQEVLKRLQIDKLMNVKNLGEALQRADLGLKPSEFIGSICKWILVIVFLSIAVEVLGLTQFSVFLNDVLAWLPNLLAAVLIFVATVIIAGFSEKLVKAGVQGTKMGYSKLAGSIAKWAVWIFGISAILIQLGIAKELILVLFQGLIYLIVIAGGLAFGLGGKDVAADIWKGLREKISK